MKLDAPIMLSALAAQVPEATLTMWQDLEITDLVDDSRLAHRKALFLAYPHEKSWRYIADAQRRGAMAIMLDAQTREAMPATAAASLVVPDVAQSVAALARWATKDAAAELCLVGITGTNGKTTTASMIAAIIHLSRSYLALIGTLGVHYSNVSLQTGYTTPTALKLHRFFQDMRKAGVENVVMEVSSHALAGGRVAGLRFAVGLFTNISQDHLDYHHTMDAYVAAKRLLFTQSEISVLNIDDPFGRQFFLEFGGIGYSLQKAGTWPEIPSAADILYAEDIQLTAEGSRFRVQGQAMRINLPGRFNVANAMAAIGAARALGISLAEAAHGIGSLPGVPGRMECFSGQGCTVYVDYAHTPDALERVLQTARDAKPSRLTVVFGCGGSRDKGKRPQMGAIAQRCADRCILTSDNPRDEDPAEILREIQAGMEQPADVELDRAEAIARAIREARKGEIIVVAGKGAETVQIVGAERIPFDDRDVVRNCLNIPRVSP